MLIILSVGNCEKGGWGDFLWHKPNFVKIGQLFKNLKNEHIDRQTA
jgi:hypothetical protein